MKKMNFLASRRDFLKKTSILGGSMILGAPAILNAQNKSDEVLNIAVVGLGEQGTVLLTAIQDIPNINVQAVCDIWNYKLTPTQRRLKALGKHDPKAYSDYREMLDKEKGLHAVVVATPDFWHAPVTNDALKAGLHVYCEKMMSNTIEGAKSMVRTMRETGKLLQIGHQRRSNPRYRYVLNELIKKHNITGRIMNANAQWNRGVGNSKDLTWDKKYELSKEDLSKWGFENMYEFRNWRWFKRYGGGPISDLGAHQIDIFPWFFQGRPKSIMAIGGNEYYTGRELPANVMVLYEWNTPDGIARAFYQVLTTTSAGGGYWEMFMGDNAAIKISEDESITRIFGEGHVDKKVWDKLVSEGILKRRKTEAYVAKEGEDPRLAASKNVPEFDLPVIFRKRIHQPHLENFFDAIRGKAHLNCPADHAFECELAVYKVQEAIAAKTQLLFKEEDFIV